MICRPNGKKLTTAALLAAVVGLNGQDKPDIILIMTDQQTADAMSSRGNPNVKTPAMDMLAADGISFYNAYCSYPLSGPSRASLFTGKMPFEINVPDNETGLPASEVQQTLGFRLAEAGYECLYAGKWHIPDAEIPDGVFGFRKISGMNDLTLNGNVSRELSKKRNKPLFLVTSFLNPHEICEYARSQKMHYGEVPIPENAELPVLPENFNAVNQLPEGLMIHKTMSPRLYPTMNYNKTDWRKYLYTYYRLVEQVDRHLAELIVELKKNNLYDNSLIVFLSDHGDGTAAHQWNQKRALFQETINVPLIVKPPLGTNNSISGKTSRALVNIGIDIYPTLCDYAGSSVPDDRKGYSLKSLIEGKTTNHHNSIFIETLLDGINIRGWCVIEGDYKYIYYRMFKNKEQLFNLKADKLEKNNLVNKPYVSKIRIKMRQLLLEHALQTKDQVLQKEMQQ